MSHQPRCPYCRAFLYLDALRCPACDGEVAFALGQRQFVGIRHGKALAVAGDESEWFTCSNRGWNCNWLVRGDAGSGQCASCRLTRKRPDADDTIAWTKLATTEEAKRRLVLQLCELGLPVRPWSVAEGGLGFDLLSSISLGTPVMIGHAGGIVTIDLAESLDDRREALRIKLGEPYRTMLGHLRHEVGHYYQNVLITDDQGWARCRDLFGDERASYQDAIDRHYKLGAPEDWATSYLSEYATMHPWEDFAETFAHYLHITGTLQTSAAIGIVLTGDPLITHDDVVPLLDYTAEPVQRIVADWRWMAQAFNRINRSMGLRDLYPFELPAPVVRKLGFVHDLVTRAPLTRAQQEAVLLGRDIESGADAVPRRDEELTPPAPQ